MQNLSDEPCAAVAERVRAACLAAAKAAYEDAAASGLCGEGALEAALSAIQMLDLKPLLSPHDRVGE